MTCLYTKKTKKYIYLLIIFVHLLVIESCTGKMQGPNSVAPATEILATKLATPSQEVIQTTAPPTVPPTATDIPADLISLQNLDAGNYLVVRKFDPYSKKYVLQIVSQEGKYIGEMERGHDYTYAAISPDLRWLAYVDGINENSVLHVRMISSLEDTRLMRGCKYPSWSPDSQYLTAACKEIIGFSYSDGEWKQIGTIPLPEEFSDLPESAKEAVQLISPSWSPDGKSIAYYAMFLVLQPENSVLGPYISHTSCLLNKIDCSAYKYDLGDIHPSTTLQWLHLSDKIAISSFDNESNRSTIYLFNISTQKTEKAFSLTNDGFIDSFSFSQDDTSLAYKVLNDSAYILKTNNGDISNIITPIQTDRFDVLFWITIP